jgi:hypothetical protein
MSMWAGMFSDATGQVDPVMTPKALRENPENSGAGEVHSVDRRMPGER